MADTQHPGVGSADAPDTPHGPSLTIDEVYDRRMARQEQATAAEPATPPQPAEQGGGDDAGNTLEAEDSAAIDEAAADEAAEADPDDTSDDEAAPDEDDAEDEAERLYTVIVDGTEQTVTASELVKGYQRQADYTRKQQALAETRRATEEQQRRLQAEAQQITEAQRYYTEASQRYSQLVEALGNQVQDDGKRWENVDWERLKADDRFEYLNQRAEYQQFREKQAAVQAEKQRLAAEQATERQQAVAKAQDHLRRSLTSMFPQWADETVRAREIRRMNAYAAKVGIPEQALATEYNPAVWKLLADAAEADALRSSVQQAKHPPAKAAKASNEPGTPPQPIRLLRPDAARPSPVRTARATEVAALKARAQRTGSVDDVFAWREARLLNKPR